jgi:hypothetical protein
MRDVLPYVGFRLGTMIEITRSSDDSHDAILSPEATTTSVKHFCGVVDRNLRCAVTGCSDPDHGKIDAHDVIAQLIEL